ncbi:MAG: hypothetical protein ACKVJG_25030 [Candidatus Latescibacterota bacterium]
MPSLLIERMVGFAETARREGILALEAALPLFYGTLLYGLYAAPSRASYRCIPKTKFSPSG